MSIVLSESSIFVGSKPMALQQLSSSNPGYTIVNVYNLESNIKNYSKFFDSDKLFLVDNPTNDQIKIIGQLNNNQYHLFFDDESFDGRNSFIAKIKKSGKIFDHSFPMFGDVQSLKRCCYKEVKSLDIKIDQPCYEWIINNCPTYRIKSKTSGNKKTLNNFVLTYKQTVVKGNIELTANNDKSSTIKGSAVLDTTNIDDLRRLVDFKNYNDAFNATSGKGKFIISFATVKR